MPALPTPESQLGFPVGADRRLADWSQITAYFRLLAESSDRMRLVEMGASTEGRPFFYALISSPTTLSRLDHFRNIQSRLADPRHIGASDAEALIAEGKTVVMISCSIHATEVGGAQMSMELAHDLLAGEDEETATILDHVILCLVPSLNPDGLDLVVDWYRQTLDTPLEGTPPPVLYHKYAGHDNNRDWFMLNLVENRLTVEHLHNVWHPQVVFDLHQMAPNGFRFFLPPYIDPFDPEVDPILQRETAVMGLAMAMELQMRGKTGVTSSTVFDAYSPSRAYQHYHGGVRILSEAASARLATPIRLRPDELRAGRDGADPGVSSWAHPEPWPGGEWRLRDIVDYDKIAAWACLLHAARYRDRWLRNFYLIGRKAVERQGPPFAFVLPPGQRDPGAVGELVEVLLRGQVEVYEAEEPLVADGICYGAGTLVVPSRQPYGSYARTLLGLQRYPDLRQYPGGPPKLPYDVTGHSLPLMLGVRAVPVTGEFEFSGRPVTAPPVPAGRVRDAGGGDGYGFSCATNASVRLACKLLDSGVRVWRLAEAAGDLPAGSYYYIPGDAGPDPAALAGEYGLELVRTGIPAHVPRHGLRLPRVALYRGLMPNADEGWTRYVFEQYGMAYTSVTDADVRGGRLSGPGCDCLVIPSTSPEAISAGIPRRYAGMAGPAGVRGLGEEGRQAVAEFVESGGTLVALDAACDWAITALGLPVVNVLGELGPDAFFVPGSILRAITAPGHALTWGLPRELPVLFLRSPAFAARAPAEAAASYPETNPLLSGFVLGEKHLHGRAALVEVPVGRGRVVLVGFRCQFRAQTRGTYRVLFNALLESALSPA